MATNQGRGTASNKKKSTSSQRNTNSRKSSTGSGRSTSGSGSRNRSYQSEPMDEALRNEIILIVLLAVAIVLFLCNFGVVGKFGNAVSNFMFGMFGLLAYVTPIFIFLGVAFGMSNIGNMIATRKLVSGVVLFILIDMICEIATAKLSTVETYQIKEIYARCSEHHNGGGIIAGSLAYASYKMLGLIGTVLVILVLAIISLVIVTEKSFINGVQRQGRWMYERSVEDAEYRKERARERREAYAEKREREQELRRLKEEEKENEKILRMDRKVSGVMLDTTLVREQEKEPVQKIRDDVHEITVHDEYSEYDEFDENVREEQPAPHSVHYIENDSDALDEIKIQGNFDGQRYSESMDYREVHNRLVNEMNQNRDSFDEQSEVYDETTAEDSYQGYEELLPDVAIHKDGVSNVEDYVPLKPQSSYTTEMGNSMASQTDRERPRATVAKPQNPESMAESTAVGKEIAKQEIAKRDKKPMPYKFPPVNLLEKGNGKTSANSERELKETALRLQQTLGTFGVKATITDISQGPSVTRYELQPEPGVKVSKIVGLTDDIKLNLAATDIRIEAPIPGKAAVGIEVPNKETMPVAFRDLIESKEFRDFDSNLVFAVGKDIGGKTVVADIAKMPHMLIAGSTGSGKSVCINTIIMGILYKTKPEDVKLIMVDPKVVELSVYNGIPHLLIPVVTDPKKASAALNWAVAEMTDRYKKFADYNVRDLKGYNKKVESMRESGDQQAPAKLPQILIIVDELADLMMVSPGEVEDAICRLAQLARACGIHLIIATQRPSVDVITGLIKANMPSRVAFAVSSGVDSRTILDMVGAEKLLGKGDMLFYPQGYPKPARIQGAFVSDREVSDVVDFLKNQAIGNVYDEEVEEQIKKMGSGSGGGNTGVGGDADGGSGYDEYFVDAGRFILEKNKASIGMLQRVFKIGFNRAARIMDQLCEAGVVGEEEGTKPRKILMTEAEFEQFVEETI